MLIFSEDLSKHLALQAIVLALTFLFGGFLTYMPSRIYRFSFAWWAYTFPMTGAAIATIRYSNEVRNVVTQALAVMLSAASTLTVTALLVTTIVHAFVLQDLFPNDIAIAISDRKPRHHYHRRWFHLGHGSSENKEIENYMKYASSDCKDMEASLGPSSSDTSNEV